MTKLTDIAHDSFMTKNTAAAVARRVSRVLAEAGFKRSTRQANGTWSDGFTVKRYGHSANIIIAWTDPNCSPTTSNHEPYFGHKDRMQQNLWKCVRDAGYKVDDSGWINTANKNYFTPPPERRTPLWLREQLEKLDNERLAYIAKMEVQANAVALKELLEAAHEAEDAFRAFAGRRPANCLTEGTSEAEAVRMAERIRMACIPFEPTQLENSDQ